MTISDPSTSAKKHKKAKSMTDSKAEQTEVSSVKDVPPDINKKNEESIDSQIMLHQKSGEGTLKKKKAAAAESITTNPTDEVNTVSNDGHRRKEKKRKRAPETSDNQTQLEKRAKKEEPLQETNTKQKPKAATDKKIRKKKRKGKDNSETFEAADGETETQPADTPGSDKKVPKKKKRPKEKQMQENPEADDPAKPSAKDLAKSYLKLWKKDKSNWSFKKVRQIWLIKHLYDAESINKKYFKYLLQYLEESKGAVRSRLIENAQSIYESSSSNADGEDAPDPVKVERARMIIQMLSE